MAQLPTTTTEPGGGLSIQQGYSEVYISDNSFALNVGNADVPDFTFLGSQGFLNTLGAPFFEGTISNFQAGDRLTLQDVPSPWTSISYDQTTESLSFLNNGTAVASLTIDEQVVGQYTSSSFSTSYTSPQFIDISVSTPAVASVVAVLSASRSTSAVTAGPGVEHVVAPGVDLQVLPGQSLLFNDGILSFDQAAFQASDTQLPAIFRLYETLLGRAPDIGGERFWNSQLDHGEALYQEASFFLQSDEYQSLHAGLATHDFVALLYQNGLGRAPDLGGLAYWTGLIDNGASRTDVAVGISQSAESVARSVQIASIGVFHSNG